MTIGINYKENGLFDFIGCETLLTMYLRSGVSNINTLIIFIQ